MSIVHTVNIFTMIPKTLLILHVIVSIVCAELAPWDKGGFHPSWNMDYGEMATWNNTGFDRSNLKLRTKSEGFSNLIKPKDSKDLTKKNYSHLFNISLASARNVDSLFHQNGILQDGINYQHEILALRTAMDLPTTNISTVLRPNSYRGSFGAPNPPPMANPAGCIPAMEVVPIAMDHSPSVHFFPTCTRIQRCGGCCSHHLLTCKATKTENVELSVLSIDPVGGKDSMTVVNMTRHLECQCGCRIQPEDCTAKQVYKEDQCGCVCAKKEVCPPNQFWDSWECQCRCKNVVGEEDNCSTGLFYNNATCRCENLQEIQVSTSRPPYYGPERGGVRGKPLGGRAVAKGRKNQGPNNQRSKGRDM